MKKTREPKGGRLLSAAAVLLLTGCLNDLVSIGEGPDDKKGGSGAVSAGGSSGASAAAGTSATRAGTGGKGGKGGNEALAGEAGAPSRGGSGGVGGAAGRVSTAGRGGSASGGASGTLGEAGGGATDAVDTVLEINDAQLAALCHGVFSCLLTESDTLPGFRAMLGDESTCRRILRGSVTGNSGVDDLAMAVEAGRVLLDLDAVASCLEARSSCDNQRAQQASTLCRSIYVGTQAMGDSCFRDEECMTRRCVIADACPGICQPLAAPGEACEEPADCDGSTGLAQCVGMCRVSVPSPRAGEGEECWRIHETEEPRSCATGLWCQGDGDFPLPPGSSPGIEYRKGLCRSTPIPAGEACEVDEDVCEPGYFCRGEGEKTCRPVLVADDAGAACDDTASFCNIFERLECVDGFCERTSDGLEGSPCKYVSYLGHRACEPGLVCVVTGTDDPITEDTPQTCLPPRAAGEPCRRAHECASETCGPDNRCTDRFCETAMGWF